MNKKQKKFYTTIMDFYHNHARDNLPGRKNTSTYYIVVSEIMLQQTQVERVVPFFKNGIKLFPNGKKLAEAKQSEVLRAGKGLGYNSRALRLQKLAQIITQEYRGNLPQDKKELESLPGIGPYTAGAVLAFAFNKYTPIIETNIRRVIIHHFFKNKEGVLDKDILKVLEKIPIENPREGYGALMDYGSHLKTILPKNPNQKSKHYTKQKQFEESDRQFRGLILEQLLTKKSFIKKTLQKKINLDDTERFEKIILGLEKDNFITIEKEKITLN